MRKATQIKGVTELPVAQVETRERLRPVSEAGVEAIMSSVRLLGVMKDPIQVRKVKHRAGALELMAGAHRLEAARRMGWETIPAAVWDCTDDWAELMEIDDNAAQQDLTALDTAVFLAKRKRIYEKLHPETKAGAFKGNRHTGSLVADTMSATSFAKVTAEKFGVSERQVRRYIAAGEALDDLHIVDLRNAPRPVTGKDLETIAKLGDATERMMVCKSLAKGEAKNASAALKAFRRQKNGEPPAPSKDEVASQKLGADWAAATLEAQRRFVASKPSNLLRLVVEEHPDAARSFLELAKNAGGVK